MSTTYTDLPGTNYPDGWDVFENKNDVSRDMQPYVTQYKQMIENGDYAGAKKLLDDYPQLKKTVISANDFNKLQDAISAMQRFVTRSEQQVVFSAEAPSDQVAGDVWIDTDGNSDVYLKTADGTYQKQGSFGTADTAKEADNGIHVYTHTKTGTVHNLVGTGRDIKFISTAAWNPGDTMTINGQECRCFDRGGTRVEGAALFTSSVLVSATLSGTSTEGVWNCFFELGVSSASKGKILSIELVSKLPENPVATTLYLIPKG